MKLLDYLNLSCPVCCNNSFSISADIVEGSYSTLNREGDFLNFCSGNKFSLNIIEEYLKKDKVKGSHRSFKIVKVCDCDQYMVFKKYTKKYISNISLYSDNDFFMEDFKIILPQNINERVKQNSKIYFSNHYYNNYAEIRISDDWVRMPIINVSKLNFKDPIQVLNKLESLISIL